MRLLAWITVGVLAAGVYHAYHYRRPRRGLAQTVHAAVARATSNRVQVRVTGGVVTLRGTVPNAERDAVLAAALAVPGVTQVRNYLETDEPVGDLGPMQAGIATGV